MFAAAGRLRVAGVCLGVLVGCLSTAPGSAQTSTEGFITGTAAQAWEKWFAGMQAILNRDEPGAEAAFSDLLKLNPSPLRVALLADHLVRNTSTGGALLLFEQDLEADALGPGGKQVAQLLATGKEQVAEADDGFYFCQLGRFDVAQANFKALLDASPDPVALLEFTDQVSKRRDILMQLLDHPVVGGSVRALLKLLDRGELQIKADPTRIREHIERLGGPPRGFENAVQALKDSGEYAVPFIVQYLRDSAERALMPAILRALPKIDRPALNPLVMALRMNDDPIKAHLIEALGEIGYLQALPYLLSLQEDQKSSPLIREAVAGALAALRARSVEIPEGLTAARAFLTLADDYYADKSSLACDPRLEQANVWYWRTDLLENVPVPSPIFNEIMCMRCCEEALRAQPELKPALALWIAANFRREAQLADGGQDPTRPVPYPPAAYFAQSAGAEYCLMALGRAVDTSDPAVALGAIEALRRTAGPASLIGDPTGRLPLAEALTFPDRLVRVRAAITLGAALPLRAFQNHQNLMPALIEALMLHAGARNALVVDPQENSMNAVIAALRAEGFEVLSDASLLPGLEKVRTQLPGVDVIFIASDVRGPDLADGLQALRREYRFASTPVVIITKPGSSDAVRDLVRGDYRLADVPELPTTQQVKAAVGTVLKAVGSKLITPELGAQLALEAAQVLRELSATNNPLFPVADAEPALLASLSTPEVPLRLTIAEVLGYLGTPKSQEAVARVALDKDQPEDMRVKMFAALAEAAKRRGNLLDAALVQQVVTVVEKDENMTIREAASRALGALNVSSTPASEIIRNQYRG